MNSSTQPHPDATITLDTREFIEKIFIDGIKGAILWVLTIVFEAAWRFERDNFLYEHKHILYERTGKCRYVANGFHKARNIGLCIGISIFARVPRIFDRCFKTEGLGDTFNPTGISLGRPYADECYKLATILHQKGISGDKIHEIMDDIYNKKTRGFKKSNISLLKYDWIKDYNYFLEKDLSKYKNHILMIDGTYVKTKNNSKKVCIFSAIVVDDIGYTVIGWYVAVQNSNDSTKLEAESEEAWTRFFDQLISQGMGEPRMVITDGGVGGLAAIKSVFPKAMVQRCWVHKIRNVLSLIKRKDYKFASDLLKDIFNSPTYEIAYKNYIKFTTQFKKRKKAVDCVSKDIDQLLTFYSINDVDHYRIYTTNIIESLFSIAKLFNFRCKGKCSVKTIGFTMFKSIEHLAEENAIGRKSRATAAAEPPSPPPLAWREPELAQEHELREAPELVQEHQEHDVREAPELETALRLVEPNNQPFLSGLKAVEAPPAPTAASPGRMTVARLNRIERTERTNRTVRTNRTDRTERINRILEQNEHHVRHGPSPGPSG